MLKQLNRLLNTVATAAGIYIWLGRPRMLRWGATDEEVTMAMPGDDIVPDAKVLSTRAVAINRKPENVFPWLVQMGQGRAGLYSYDWLENLLGLNIHSSRYLMPEFQQLEVGDIIRLVPEDSDVPLWLEVAILEPNEAVVLRSHGNPYEFTEAGLPNVSWAFILREQPDGSTRLVTRYRANYKPTFAGTIINHYALEPIHFMMERRMLLGIKERVEWRNALGNVFDEHTVPDGVTQQA